MRSCTDLKEQLTLRNHRRARSCSGATLSVPLGFSGTSILQSNCTEAREGRQCCRNTLPHSWDAAQLARAGTALGFTPHKRQL